MQGSVSSSAQMRVRGSRHKRGFTPHPRLCRFMLRVLHPSPSRGEGKFIASHAQRPAGSRRSQEETRSSECRDAPSEQHQNQLRRQKTRRLIRAPGAEIRCDENRMPFDQTPPRKTRGVHQRFAFSPRKSLTNMESAYHFLGAQNVLADRMDDTI